MPPQAGRSAVGSGQRAFANGEGLRLRGHQVFYCTRTEDLPEQLRGRAEARRDRDPLRLTLTGDDPPPGDAPRKRMPLGMAIGASPEEGRSDDPLASIDWSEAWGMGAGDSTARPRRSNWTPDVGLAPTGGPAGAPGNPFNFTESHELHDVIRKVDPDVVLLEAMEEARRLPDGRFAVVLDAFAPRVLEQQFQSGADQREAILVLDALQRADHFIYSNERQKYFHLPLLALAGVDCTQNAGDVVRISCPPDLPPVQKPRDPIFVAGGVFWPWADLSTGLGSLLSILEARSTGNIHLYGGEYALRSDTTEYTDPRETLPRDHARLQFKGMVPVDELWDDYRNATVAFDLMAPNPEREINLSFRQIDYLRCGLPIITAPRQVIAADLLEYGAGWTIEPGDTEALRALVDRLIDNPDEVAVASAAAQKLARERYAWDVTTAPLDAFIRQPRRRQSRETVVGRIARTQADLWDEHRAAKRLRDKVLDLQDELEKKSEEVGQVNARMRELITSVDRLSGSLQEVSRFKSDTLRYLHEEQDATVKDVAEAERELERRALDLRKKQGALDKAHSEIDKLKQSLGELRTDAEGTEARFITRDRAASELEAERRDLSRTISELRRESADYKREANSKSSALGELRSALQRLEARYIDRLGEAESSARELLNQATERVSEAVLARGRATTDLADTRGRLITAEGDLAKKTAELEDVQERAREGAAKHETLLHAQEAARARQAELQAEVGNARAESEKRRSEVEAVRTRMRLQAKESHTSLEASEARWLERFERAESEARQVLSEATKRVGTVETARSQLQSKLSEARERLTRTAGELAKKTAELEDVQERAREGAAKHETLLHAQEAARARQAELQAEVGNARAESEKRRSEVEAVRTRMRLQAKESHTSLEASEARWLERFERAESEAREVLSEATKRAGTVETARSQLQSKLSDARERLTMAAGELDKKNVELSELQRRGREESARLVAENAAQTARLVAKQNAETDLIHASQRDALDLLIAEARDNSARTQREHQAEASRVQADHQTVVARLQSEHQTELALALDEHRAAISRVQEDRKDEVTRLQSATKAEVNRLQAQHRAQLDRVETRAIEAGAHADALAHELAETATEALQGKSRLSDALGDVRKKAAEVEALRRRLAEERVQSMAALDTAEERALSDVQRARMDAEAHLSSLRTETESRLQSLQTRSERQVRQLQQESTARTLATEERLREISLERADLADRLERAEYDLGALRTNQKKTAKLLTTAQEQRDATQKELDASRRAYTVATDDAAGRIAQLGGRVEELDFEVASLRTELTAKVTELDSAYATRDAVQKEMATVHQAANRRVKRADKDLEKSARQIEELQFEVEAASKEALKKAAEIDALRNETDNRMKAVTTEFAFEELSLKTDLQKKSVEVDSLLNQRTSLQSEMSQLEAERLQLDATVRKLDTEVRTLREQLAAAASGALTKAAKMATTKRKDPPKTNDGDDVKAEGSDEKKTEVKGGGIGARLLRRL